MSDTKLDIYRDLLDILSRPALIRPHDNKELGFAAEILLQKIIEVISQDLSNFKENK